MTVCCGEPDRSRPRRKGSGKTLLVDSHDLGVAGLHRKLEVVEIVFARDSGEFQGAFHHPQGRVTEPVHDSVAQGTMIRPDAQRAIYHVSS